jgi:hypothetical protein
MAPIILCAPDNGIPVILPKSLQMIHKETQNS